MVKESQLLPLFVSGLGVASIGGIGYGGLQILHGVNPARAASSRVISPITLWLKDGHVSVL